MTAVPRSDVFDDVYFSADNGLAETNHVFVQGNDLPAAWQGCNHFTIGEAGFGTGLNFLTVWKLFDQTAPAGAWLDYVSYEKFPLTPDQIRDVLLPWADEFSEYLEPFLSQYPLRIAGWHRILLGGRVSLTLIFDDINAAMPRTNACVDCWFLDGFTPAKNPDMWSETVFQEIARMSHQGTSFATFTAAGDVRRGLEKVGFTVEKKPGYGRKRDMLAGQFTSNNRSVKSQPVTTAKNIAIIGGGLAGTACAYTLKQYGFHPTLYEQADHIAAGASGNKIGLTNPRLSALRGPESDFYGAAYAQITNLLKNSSEVAYKKCGSLHLMNDNDKRKRLLSANENWLWHNDHMRLVEQEEMIDVASIEINYDGLLLQDSAVVSPYDLCHFYTNGIDIRLNQEIPSLDMLEADAVILACGVQAKNFIDWLPLHTVRGQISYFKETDKTKNIGCNICYGGYISGPLNGMHAVGSTFHRALTHQEVREEDHDENLAALDLAMPHLKEKIKINSGQAALRTASKDRFPIIGSLQQYSNLYLSTAHGSHGIVTSLAAAHLIADQLRGGVMSLPKDTIYQLSAQRFLDRERKKSGNKI